MASFRCYDDSDVIVTLILTIFHLHLIQLGNFAKFFVYGDVGYRATLINNTRTKVIPDKFKCQGVIHHHNARGKGSYMNMHREYD